MVKITKHSGIYTLEATQRLPMPLHEAWDFFSSPANLARITPPEMGFNITSGNTKKAYEGQIITYKIGILPFVKSNWVTEITRVRENEIFIDEQRFGPYRMWHHEHWFTADGDGTMMFDKVSYKIPFGWLGQLVHALFIKRKLRQIFTFRHHTLRRLFG
ncbi:SRPBCC family protein [Roseimarinus sediminis]|uniref:SRPBCC family protein n=1 Tax=Roseimarinus sediminis TaxID=1610899 RepID=UPI003D1CCDAE